ncbi:hypothetical protein Tco_0583884 [Tanacetum coccineum]
MDEDHARSDPGISRVALTGPDPEPTYDEFMANVYPNVQESLKFLADEHVILEDPLSSTETLSSMKNLEDVFAIGDRFFNDKSIKDEPGKLNVEAEVVYMVTVLIYQAVFTLELRDLPHKIDETIRETIKEAAQRDEFFAEQDKSLMRYFSFGRHLDGLHVTWDHLEEKQTRLQTNTKTLEDLCSQSQETAPQSIHDAVTTHPVTVSHISRRLRSAPTQMQI